MSEDSERTEAPTTKRREKAADDGQILRSKDFATALVVLAGVVWMAFFGPSLMKACQAVMAASFQFGRGDVEDFEPFRPLAEAGWKLAPSLFWLLAISVAAGILSQASLSRVRFKGGLMAPKFSRINPASGIKRIFGLAGWTELLKSVLKVTLLGSIGWFMLWRAARTSMGLASSDLQTSLASLGGTFTGILFAMAAGLLVIAGIDLPIQILQLFNKLKMSKQDVKDEHKESEGSPEAKHAMKSRQREVLKRSSRKAVASAHVVLTNPTHFAVALRYDRGKDQIPVLVAKGRGVMALAIRELAGELDVPVLEYPALARAVYYTSKENQEVRDDLYAAIATVLAFVFGLNAAAGARPLPSVAVPPTARFDENGAKQL
jgi:flagellar biosynthetic protein FlhB